MSSKSAREELRRGLWPDKDPKVEEGIDALILILTVGFCISSVVALALLTLAQPEWIP